MAGESDKMKGRAKQAVGDLTDDEELEREGERDEAAGEIKDRIDDAEERANDAIDSVRDRLND